MPSQGYVRFPNIFQEQIVFVAEDDLWLVSAEGGRAERLTAGVGEVRYPHFSPDGQLIAFVGREEGPSEVYVMPAQGGPAQRLTFQAGNCRVLGWSPDGEEILYSSNAGQFAGRFEVIYGIKPSGGMPHQLPLGMANDISYSKDGGVVIGRNVNIREFSHWKRYRGGTAGHLWCDRQGDGNFKRLLQLTGNVADPCWIGERIYFLSDHDGIGNIYSCTPDGEDLRQHTRHTDFYARHLSTDGTRLVYHSAADLYLFDPRNEEAKHLEISLPSIRTQRSRKFVSAANYLDSYALHPQGHMLALTTRGKAFTFGNWEGPVLQYGEPDGVRYRFLEWLADGRRLVAVHDAPGHEELIIFAPDGATEPQTFPDIDLGRVTDFVVSPTENALAIANHRNELLLVDLDKGSSQVLDRSEAGRIDGISWSPDGGWIAYGFAISSNKSAIKLCRIETGETHQVTDPILQDSDPAFDPEGKYLYFLGQRVFNPVSDNLHFDLGFPRGVKPYVIILRKDLRSPFIPESKSPDEKEKEKENGSEKKAQEEIDAPKDADQENSKEKKDEGSKKGSTMTIDLDGISERILPFPVAEGRYTQVRGIRGKALFLSHPVEGNLNNSSRAKGVLEYYDFENYKTEKVLDGVGSFDLSRDSKFLVYRSQQKLRVVKAGEKLKTEQNNNERASRESGWIDLQRVKVSVQPFAEWKQMFAEAWRLQREQFWSEDMSGIDWDGIYQQYAPLVERISSRSELSDLLWELHGELGTSHAYEMGGDVRHGPHYRQGFLGVDWVYDADQERYRIARIVKGDSSDSQTTSPFTSPGLNVKVNDAVLAINGQRVGPGWGPQELLVNQAGNEVQITIEDAETKESRVVVVKALSSETSARYREWVENNRRTVHKLSNNRVGYIHIPDMGSNGYAEFHRGYLSEYDYPALLVDVRWNGGGNVSGLLLEKLARRRIGYDFPRWGQPEPYPGESPRGPMVALTNEHAGSDGDIFSHSFKLMGLGPLIGKRTWGGVIGIYPRHRLVDGTVTTQPEFSFWFKDVGWNVENYGTDPDIEVDIAPQDFVREVDPQLERALAEALRLADEYPTLEPKPGERPRLGRLNNH
ncbi:S41 family peptidase [Dictyobacter aurantiacus]|uniref:Tricorn protease homolog n=1 Tax=Dictyobacter aurantiacus TaxID=1936993 RepID=A0A401ZGC4_9CHLR|nr:S41 family peptidase [Dictyobacter aurantiacus]GCE05899.1 tricorn protease [Dictyobacter aurantiacus]